MPSPISRITFFGLSESSARAISFVLSGARPPPPAITAPAEQAVATVAAVTATNVFLARMRAPSVEGSRESPAADRSPIPDRCEAVHPLPLGIPGHADTRPGRLELREAVRRVLAEPDHARPALA